MGAVDGWGVQFGQTMEAPVKGKTYTFAVLAKSLKEPVALELAIERHTPRTTVPLRLRGRPLRKTSGRSCTSRSRSTNPFRKDGLPT